MFQANFKNRSTQPQQINGERLRYTGRQLVDGVTHKQEAIVQLLYPVGVARVIHWVSPNAMSSPFQAYRLSPTTIVANSDLLLKENDKIIEIILRSLEMEKYFAERKAAQVAHELHGSETASVL